MTKRVVVSTLTKPIGQLEIDGVSYPLLAPNGYVAQEIENAEQNPKITDAYRLVGLCAPTVPKDVLLKIAVDDIAQVMEGIRDALLEITREVLPEAPKATAAATS